MNGPQLVGPLSAADVMQSLLMLFSVAFFLALALTPVVRNLARSRGWLDRPDGRRKLHSAPVPRLGGLALYCSFALSVAASVAIFHDAPWYGVAVSGVYLRALAACTAVMLVGLVDDLVGTTPTAKIAVQVAASFYLYNNGYQIHLVSNPFGEAIALGVLSLPITLLWFVGMSNAFNLIDGLDGLAAGVGLFCTSIVFIFALSNDRWEIVFLSVALGGALLGFLRYNFSPASIFLGDSGALFIGFALAALSVRGSTKSSTAIAVVAPLLALGFPILDTGMAVLRRLVRGRSLLEPDADHIHHRMVRRGLTQHRAVIILYGVTALFGALSLLTMTGRSQIASLVAVAAFTAITWWGIRELGYSEIGEIGRFIMRVVSWGRGNRKGGDFGDLRPRIREARDLEELWDLLVHAGSRAGLHSLSLHSLSPASRLSEETAVRELRSWEKAATPQAADRMVSWTLPLISGGTLLGQLTMARVVDDGDVGHATDELVSSISSEFSDALYRILRRPGPA